MFYEIMDLHVITICLLIFVNYSVAENAETIRNQHKPEGMINKLMPQQMYTIPNGVPNVSPALNLRLNNAGNNVPRIVVPVVNQQPNAIRPNYPTAKVVTPVHRKKPDSNTATSRTIPKDEKPKENVPEIKFATPKEPQFVEDVEQFPKYLDPKRGKKEISQDKPQIVKKQNVAASKNTESSQPTNNNKQPGKENVSKTTSPVDKDINTVLQNVNKNESSPRTESKKSVKKDKQETTGRRKNDSNEVDAKPTGNADGKKDSLIFTIYKLDDDENKYSRTSRIEPNVYTDNVDYINQPTSNLIIKNHDIEEMCERAQDPIISTYQPDPYNQQYNYEIPNIYQPSPEYYHQNFNTMPSNYEVLPNPYQNDANCYTNSGMESNNSKDRVWRNWKSTEIYISNYDPVANKFNNGYFRNNGFSTPFMNGDVIGCDYRNANTPFPYQCYSYPMNKYVY